ncbi:regucalcin [Auriculariales sp. MPI-PUGE-AT-0066]|nr:regucalcin [Auriculariales sp. MPI-PUGE-AT-0066]
MPSSITVTEPLVRAACVLGEGPLWDLYTSTLHFVDIQSRQARTFFMTLDLSVTFTQVLHYNTLTRQLTRDQYAEAVTCLLAGATSCGIALLNNGSLSYLSKPLPTNEASHTRFNDGACDRRGRLIVGTVQSADGRVQGKLYSYDPSTKQCKVLDTGFTVSGVMLSRFRAPILSTPHEQDGNGLGWSADDRILYFTDSLVNRIYAYDYKIDTGVVSNRRTFIDACALGYPRTTYCDGLCIDSEGCIWSARWANSKITRHKRDGSVDFEVLFPHVYTVTSCCFGGPNLDQLFVTTAHCGANNGPSEKQARFPYSGDLFVVNLAGRFKGLARFEFGL